jgi:glycosyltransferase involved in cell wall biosynthesis
LRAGIFADQLFYAQPGGIGTYLKELIPGIAGKDDSRLLLFHHAKSGSGLFPELGNIEETRIPHRRDVMGLSWHLIKRPAVERYIGETDVVHTPSLVFPPTAAPLVATVHDLCILKYPWAFPTRWRVFHRRGLQLILKHARIILADSESTCEDLRKIAGRRDPRVRTVALGVNKPRKPKKEAVASVLARYELEPGFLLYVGTIEPRKNLSRLAKAYASFNGGEKRKAGELVLVGPAGWMGRRELSGLLAQHGIRWLGFVPQEDLEALYAAAALFVYPSIYEGFGLPVLEAMARGVPVVTANSSSLREIGEGVALLVDPEDPMEIGRAIKRLVGDARMRKELAAKGKERAGEYPWQRTIDLTYEAYREAAGQ